MNHKSLLTGLTPIQRVLFWVAGIGVIVAFFALNRDPPYTIPEIESEPFEWPAGCPEKDYKGADKIARACVLQSNYFHEWKKYGLHLKGNDTKYFRVRDDLIAIYCGRRDDPKCNIYAVAPNAFVRRKQDGQ